MHSPYILVAAIWLLCGCTQSNDSRQPDIKDKSDDAKVKPKDGPTVDHPPSKGFQKIDGRWTFVTWDTASGKTVHSLNADDGTFSVLKDPQYAKDKDRVFYRFRTIDAADPATFQVINDDKFAKDKKHVFIMTHRIPEADPASFKVLKRPYSRDGVRVYCGMVALQNVNVEAFEPVECYGGWQTILDKGTFLFEFGEAFDKLEISQKHPVLTGEGWGRDGKYYYHGPGRVEGADYATFRIDSEYRASDKNRKYWHVFPEEQSLERRKRFLGVKE